MKSLIPIVAIVFFSSSAIAEDFPTDVAGVFGTRDSNVKVIMSEKENDYFVGIVHFSRNCTANISGPAKRIRPYALSMSVKTDQADSPVCTIDLTYARGFGSVQVKESSACLDFHGVSCNFEGTFKRIAR